jgi:hypothetical protein
MTMERPLTQFLLLQTLIERLEGLRRKLSLEAEDEGARRILEMVTRLLVLHREQEQIFKVAYRL